MQLPVEIEFALSGDWASQAEALMDEHHMVAVSDDESVRIEFGTHLVMQMERMADTEVCVLYGRFIRSLEEFAYMLSRAMAGRRVIEPNRESLIEALGRQYGRTKRRYVVWHDAHLLADRKPRLFDEVADCLMGVAAEREYASEDTLILTRCLFLGSPTLLWSRGLMEWAHEGEAEPLWQTVSGLAKPPVKTVRVVRGYDARPWSR